MVCCISSRPSVGPCRSLVIAAGGSRDLAWSHQRVAAEMLARSGGRLVHLLLHGGARGADAAIARAARQLGWSSLVLPAQWQRHGRAAGPIRNRELLELAVTRAQAHSSPALSVSVLVVAFPGGPGTASLVQQARRMACRSPVPIAVVEVSPAAGRCTDALAAPAAALP
jgi:predicted Rossmann-fold nucleotide-binding protein